MHNSVSLVARVCMVLGLVAYLSFWPVPICRRISWKRLLLLPATRVRTQPTRGLVRLEPSSRSASKRDLSIIVLARDGKL